MIYDKKTNEILNNWFSQNISNPYATQAQKTDLAKATSLTVKQVSTWLTNARYKYSGNINSK